MPQPQRAAPPAACEAKFAPLDLKRVDADGTFSGYACLFDSVDLGEDMILQGAFRRSLRERGPAGIKLLFQHDPGQPIGVWLEMVEDARGLFVRGRLMSEVARAREVLALMRAGALDGLSIGFRTVKGVRDPSTGVRRLEEIDLWEISIVTFPMQPEARVAAVKARPFAARLPTKRELERWLTREAGLTRAEARGVLAEGFKSLTTRRDAGGEPDPGRLLAGLREATRLIRSSLPSPKKGRI
jgi:hypothetical protein